ncbi:unnamed protein product [Meloidogyne enterolobii]|uniref:Uncharacterized protein n=1 Tax=Meloidogyne enterolobii TaxID=390850 RepID=A0ACB0ZEC0_MELEN
MSAFYVRKYFFLSFEEILKNYINSKCGFCKIFADKTYLLSKFSKK